MIRETENIIEIENTVEEPETSVRGTVEMIVPENVETVVRIGPITSKEKKIDIENSIVDIEESIISTDMSLRLPFILNNFSIFS